MARKRVIDPDIFFGETFTALNVSERLLYLGLWLNADDEGRMKASTVEIKHKIFPADDISPAQMRKWFENLHKSRLICLYSVDGKDYLVVRGMRESQPLKWFTPSKLPAPPVVAAESTTTNAEIAGQVTDGPSVAVAGDGLRRDEMRREESVTTSSAPTAPTPPGPDGSDDLFDRYDALARQFNLARVSKRTDQRRSKARQRVREGILGSWSQIVASVASCGFWRGENDRGWKLDFDYLTRSEDTWRKVLERGQVVKPSSSGDEALVDAIEAELRSLAPDGTQISVVGKNAVEAHSHVIPRTVCPREGCLRAVAWTVKHAGGGPGRVADYVACVTRNAGPPQPEMALIFDLAAAKGVAQDRNRN